MVDVIYITDIQKQFLFFLIDRCQLSKKEEENVNAVLIIGSYWKNRNIAKTLNRLRLEYQSAYSAYVRNEKSGYGVR